MSPRTKFDEKTGCIMIDQTKTGWSVEQVNELCRLWDRDNPKLSTQDIGRQLGISKNAAIGKAHRLNLTPRPSPISRAGSASAKLTTLLPAGASVDRTRPTEIRPLAETANAPPVAKSVPDATPTAVSQATKPILHVVDRNINDGCSWIHGDPKKQWHFCDARRSGFRGAYCDEHRHVVYSAKNDSQRLCEGLGPS